MEEQVETKRFPRRLIAAMYAGVAALGVGFYVGWSILYGTWNLFDWSNSHVYATSVILVGVGVTGTLLYSIKDDE